MTQELILGHCFSSQIEIFSGELSRILELSIVGVILLIFSMTFRSCCKDRNLIIFQAENIQRVILKELKDEEP